MSGRIRAMKIVAISGSLRARSSHGALLRAAATVAPSGMELTIYEQLGSLPHFNPDLDGEGQAPPAEVGRFRALVGVADGIIVSTPEYAHGVPGTLKNALDWLVSSGELGQKPVALLHPAGSGQWMQAALRPTLLVMEARMVDDASLNVSLVRTRVDSNGEMSDPEVLAALKHSLERLAAAVDSKSAPPSGD
jgi:NAD(P)H-dependent FMN reductase